MRNVFDQYHQPENRVTHALFASLAEDRRLLRQFLKYVAHCTPPKSRPLFVEEQKLPGEAEPAEEEAEKRGLPDAWIHDGGEWCLLVECKVAGRVRRGQLTRHETTARHRGFNKVDILVIGVEEPNFELGSNVRFCAWKDVYSWLRSQGSNWAKRTAEFLEIAEVRMTDAKYLKKGTLTRFTGFPFGPDHPYSYGEGKRVLQLAITELRGNSKLNELRIGRKERGRPKITGKEGSSVWDYIPLKEARWASEFTKYPHLTLGVQSERVHVMVTVPNSIRTDYRNRLVNVGEQGFFDIADEITRKFQTVARKVPGAAPWFTGVQRHWHFPEQNSHFVDAFLDFDLRTAVGEHFKEQASGIKPQPQWLQSAFRAFSNKRSNFQIQFGAVFPYRTCPAIRKADSVELIADTWLCCKPLIERMRGT